MNNGPRWVRIVKKGRNSRDTVPLSPYKTFPIPPTVFSKKVRYTVAVAGGGGRGEGGNPPDK